MCLYIWSCYIFLLSLTPMEVVIGAGDGVSSYVLYLWSCYLFLLTLTPMEVVIGAGDGISSYGFIYMVVLYISTITDAHGGCYWCWR